MATDSHETADLAALVREHDVAYELTIEERATSARRPPARVGYRLLLIGSPLHDHSPITPGCPVCRETFRALVRIANGVLPHDERATRYELGPYAAAWHVSAERPRGIELSIELIGRRDSAVPDEACQQVCIADIKRGLESLGVRRAGSPAGRRGPRHLATTVP